MMRLTAALQGNLHDIMAAELKAQRKAITRTIREGSTRVKEGWRAQIRAAGLSQRLANTVRAEQYPRGRESRGAAGLVFVRAGKDGAIGSAVAALQNMSEGAVILPREGRFLAIPTGYNLRGGQRQGGRAGRVIVTPEMMVRDVRRTFTIPVANGAKLWCLRITQAQWRSQAGRVQTRNFLGTRQVSRAVARKGGRDIAKQGWAPMFVLLPRATIPRRLDLDAVSARVADALPRILLQNLTAEG